MEFYRSCNETDSAGLDALREKLMNRAGSFQMLDAAGESCLVAHAPVAATGDWTILSMVHMGDLDHGTVDWLLLGTVAAGLVLLLLVDLLYMLRLNQRLRAAAHKAGANGFISKPLFRSTLYEKISSLLGRQVKQGSQEDDNADLADMRILVAEDNDINWEVISMLLQMSGIGCTRAYNGAEAVNMMEDGGKDKYDMIFMDIQMPVMNGFEATKVIRALDDPDAASIPIIAMTADAFSENVAECFAVGMNGHVAKPIDIKHVLKEIRKVKEAKVRIN